MTTLFILNDPPYGTERVYNGLRLAANLQRLDEGHEVVVFLMGDAASAAKAGQSVPNGYYNVNKMLANVVRRNGRVLVCGTCMDARGLAPDELVDGAQRSTLDELTQETLAADKVLVF
ncbi:MAG TPA: DsrE family protein [Actinomycetota bacterium]|nr:DsrE family protein [Actinomycetota bacterium]